MQVLLSGWKSRRWGLLRENHDTFSQEHQREGVRDKLRERKSGSSHSVMEICGGWLTTRCTDCLKHHGNRERERLREAEVQGLHLFQQHFNYFGRSRLVKQMHSGAPATTGRNPQRFWCLSFLKSSPHSHICEITATIGDTETRLITREGDRGWGEEEGGEKKHKKDK